MADILKVIDETDLLVFASPIYWFDITAQLKTVIDRMYARGKIGFHFKKTALLLDSARRRVRRCARAVQGDVLLSALAERRRGLRPQHDGKGQHEDSPARKGLRAGKSDLRSSAQPRRAVKISGPHNIETRDKYFVPFRFWQVCGRAERRMGSGSINRNLRRDF